MQGSEISQQERHSRLMNEFDKFVVVEGESLTSVYEREIQGDAQKDKLTTAMMLLARAITQRNDLVQSIEEYDQNVQRIPKTESTLGKTNVQCYNYNRKGHYARKCPKPIVHDAKYFREQMLLAIKDEDVVHLDKEENDFMLDNAYGDNTLEELNATVIMMVHIQTTDDKSDAKPTYDEFISEVNATQIEMINGLLSKSNQEQRHH
ncbi:integrase, catalytic region, zinc finger, CCHC-type containing protein, partial [Tanacetum coccineum]